MKKKKLLVMWMVMMALWLGLTGCGDDDDDPAPQSSCGCKSDPVIESRGLVFLFEKQTVQKPANVSVLFKMETDEEAPVTDLTAEDFRIYEDGELISLYESRQAIVPKPGTFLHSGVLLLDLSGSILGSESLGSLKTAAKAFVNAVMPEKNSASSGEMKLAIHWFDGAADTHLLVSSTDDPGVLIKGIDSIDGEISTDSSTNLYGAVLKGVDLAKNAVKNSSVTVSAGSLVIFTDGRDQAGRKTKEEAVKAVNSAEDNISIYSIGLGSEIDKEILETLGREGFVWADNIDDLYVKFEEIATAIRADVNSHYLFEYCSPKRKGQHELKITAEYGEKSGSLTTCFCADGFEGGCVIKQ
ncbi:MAG: VWA domain-containing protein [Desulfobacterales bacterium]